MAKDDPVKEDLPFEVPKFDEDEFVRKELISFRTTLIMFVFSLLIALVSFAFWKFGWGGKDLNAGEFFVLVVFAIATGALLPYIYRMFGVDISHFRRKEWLGTVFMHFVFWIGFSLLLANPPVSDEAPPVIEAYATPAVQGVGQRVELAAYVSDNNAVDANSLRFCLGKVAGNASAAGPPTLEGPDCTAWTPVAGRPVWTRLWTPNTTGTFAFTVRACDDNGQCRDAFNFVNIGNPFPVISPDSGASFTRIGDKLAVRADPSLNLRAVEYRIAGKTYNMTPPSEAFNYWSSDPTFPGWKAGTNELTITAQEQPRYLQGHKVEGGRIEFASANRTFTVAPNFPDLNTQEEPQHREFPPPNPVGAPGFGTGALLVAILAALALALRRSKRDG